MVSVHARDADVPIVRQIMDRHRPIDPIERRGAYSNDGWQRFDPSGTPHRPTAEEIDRIRTPYLN